MSLICIDSWIYEYLIMFYLSARELKQAEPSQIFLLDLLTSRAKLAR